MRTTHVSAHWTGEGLNYVGVDSKGRQLPMGGENVSPGQLLLLAMAGCMGMDFASVMQKKRQKVTGIEVKITAHQPLTYPKPYQMVELAFVVKGENIDPKAVARAIDLSRDKYCVVGQTLQHPVDVKTSFAIEE